MTGPLFYLGAPAPGWLAKAGVPLFVSDTRLRVYKKLPEAIERWACDSGGFTQLKKFGRWTIPPKEYVARLRRYRDEIGRMDWAAPQDWMCEEIIIEGGVVNGQHYVGTRRTLDPDSVFTIEQMVEQHQRLTVLNFVQLRNLAPDLPIIPVVQGQHPEQYLLRATSRRATPIRQICRCRCVDGRACACHAIHPHDARRPAACLRHRSRAWWRLGTTLNWPSSAPEKPCASEQHRKSTASGCGRHAPQRRFRGRRAAPSKTSAPTLRTARWCVGPLDRSVDHPGCRQLPNSHLSRCPSASPSPLSRHGLRRKYPSAVHATAGCRGIQMLPARSWRHSHATAVTPDDRQRRGVVVRGLAVSRRAELGRLGEALVHDRTTRLLPYQLGARVRSPRSRLHQWYRKISLPGLGAEPAHLSGFLLGSVEADLYRELVGVDLTTEPLVGVGSVCRRQGTDEAGQILHALHLRGVTRLHGFGFKLTGLREHGHLTVSDDSMAWSFVARRLQRPALPECAGQHKNCASCFRWAMHWRRFALIAATGRHHRAAARADQDRQRLSLWEGDAA